VRMLLYILPIALLVAYSQIVVKWRALNMSHGDIKDLLFAERVIIFVSDPIILSAYAAALLASLIWLYVVARLPLVVAFPIYIGVTFCLVMIGGWLFLSENINLMRLVSISLILSGIIIGVRS
jgi:multidrug transporter EmrE-like cation transporter